jgi:citrate lyase subunit beta/citryl-CoA lyase
MLFVPGDRIAALLPKAEASDADALIIDLEDGVAATDKASARAAVRAELLGNRSTRPVFLRINPKGTSWHDDDLDLAASLNIDGVVVPKAEVPEELVQLATRLSDGGSDARILVMIETAKGVLLALPIAEADQRIIGLALGAEDLASQVGFRRTSGGREILFARSAVVLAAAAAGIWSIDTPNTRIDRSEAVQRDAVLAAALGFDGKLVIHPSQIAPVIAGFAPSPAEVERARRILDGSFDPSLGARAVAGEMVDGPILRAARRTLERAGHARGIEDAVSGGAE